MCMFSRSVTLVANTRIFARPCAAGHQVLVYSMTGDAGDDLAMILPLPIEPGSGELDVRFIDLSSYADFFDDLEKAAVSLDRASRAASQSRLPFGQGQPRLDERGSLKRQKSKKRRSERPPRGQYMAD